MNAEEYITSKHGQEAFDNFGELLWAIEQFAPDAPKDAPRTIGTKRTLRHLATGLTIKGYEIKPEGLYDVA